MLGIPTGPGNMLIKAFIAGLFLIVLPYTLRRVNVFIGPLLPILILLTLYGLRLLYDVLVRDIFIGGQPPVYVLGYFFGLTLLPVMALCGSVRRMDVVDIHKWSFAILFLANSSLLVLFVVRGIDNPLELLAGRLQVDADGADKAIINPIVIGLSGGCLAAFALGRLAVFWGRGAAWDSINLIGLLLGSLNVLLGASRGPALAFVLCVIAVAVSSLRSRFGFGRLVVRKTIWRYLLLPIAAVSALVLSEEVPVFLFERMFSFLEERVAGVGGVEQRDLIMASAWSDFVQSPLFGSGYVVSLDGSFPHNMLLESVMATGVFGGIAMVWVVAGVLRAIWRAWLGDAGVYGYPLALVAASLFVLQLTSGSIGQTPEFWVFVSCLILLVSPEQQQKLS